MPVRRLTKGAVQGGKGGGGGDKRRDWVSVEAVDLCGKSNKMCPFIAFTPTTTGNTELPVSPLTG